MNRLALISIIIIISIAKLHAQEKFPKPDLDDVPYLYDPQKQLLTDLDRTMMNKSSHAKGLTGAVSVIILPGSSAKVRVSSKNQPQFIIHFSSNEDPYSQCDLGKFTEKKGNREFQMAQAGLGHSESTVKTEGITYKKIGDQLYIITLNDLKPGEYGFSAKSKVLVYCFGVD